MTSDYTSTRDWHDADAGLLHEDAFGSVSETVDANGQIASTWEDDVTVTDSGGNWIEGTNPTETELYNPDHAGRAFGYNATSYLTGLGTTVALSGLVNQVANAEGEGDDTSTGSGGGYNTPNGPLQGPPTADRNFPGQDAPDQSWFWLCRCADESYHDPAFGVREEYEDSGGNIHVNDPGEDITGPPCGPLGHEPPRFIVIPIDDPRFNRQLRFPDGFTIGISEDMEYNLTISGASPEDLPVFLSDLERLLGMAA